MDGVILGVQIFVGLLLAPIIISAGFLVLKWAFYAVIAVVVVVYENIRRLVDKVGDFIDEAGSVKPEINRKTKQNKLFGKPVESRNDSNAPRAHHENPISKIRVVILVVILVVIIVLNVVSLIISNL